MPRQDTRLESEGAEFLVLGQLLIAGISANKSYRNTPGYDLVATNPEGNSSARISVKSRWKTKAEGFIINNFNCDFVVIVKLNRGSKDGRAEVLSPEFFVLPVGIVRNVPRTAEWGKVSLRHIPDISDYGDNWQLVRDFLNGDMSVLRAIHPGQFLREILEDRGIAQAQFARAVGMAPMRISHVVTGTRPVTAELALLFGKALGQSPRYWLNLQAAYDLKLAEQQIGDQLKAVSELESA